MTSKIYNFNTFNNFTADNIKSSLEEINENKKKPIFVCIGSDLVLGDSLGPLIGTLLKKQKLNSYIYGTLNFPITAKEIFYVKKYIKAMHPDSVVIAIDAAVGTQEDVGLIKISNCGLKPGLGVNKNLGVVGDISIIGIVAEKCKDNNNLFNLTRLNLIYKVSEVISEGIEKYIKTNFNENDIESSTFIKNISKEKNNLDLIKNEYINLA
ncbi:MAG: spore protease YyaC [Clostridia bacterium]|nr:spore protease YyaC [Clostridia bacterium]